MVWSVTSTPGGKNSVPHLRYAKRHGFLRTLEPGYCNMRIRSRVKSPLKN